MAYKDPENNGRNNVYDEIPVENRTNGHSPHITAAKQDPVYSKPIKRDTNGTSPGIVTKCLPEILISTCF